LLERNSEGLLRLMFQNLALRQKTVGLIQDILEVTISDGRASGTIIDANLVERVRELIAELRPKTDESLKNALDDIDTDLKFFKGKSVSEGLKSASLTQS
jgi:hypothetical protein